MAKAPDGPKRTVVKKLRIKPDTIENDPELKKLHATWTAKAKVFVAAREASEKAKTEFEDKLTPKLEAQGALAEYPDSTHYWEMKKDMERPGGIVVEIVKGKKGERRSRIDEEDVDF